MRVTFTVPDIEALSDEEIARLAPMRDGRWSEQTKALLLRFGTDMLDLNRAWATTWTGWCCPCCRRSKSDVARLSGEGVLLCRLEHHHDHLADLVREIFAADVPLVASEEINVACGHAKDALRVLVERFEPALLCLDCNLAEGKAKRELRREDLAESFTFSPREIAAFVSVAPNRPHQVDLAAARSTWASARDDHSERVDFARRMSRRIANGKHHRQPTAGRKEWPDLGERDIVFALFSEAVSSTYRHRLAIAVDARSTSAGSAGRKAKSRRRPTPREPTDEEYATVEARERQGRTWSAAGDDWNCACCGRTKRQICRLSNARRWTGQIHGMEDYHHETDPVNLSWRRRGARARSVFGSVCVALVCQDCRNLVTKVRQCVPGLPEDCLSISDIRASVGSGTPHTDHALDVGKLVQVALGNEDLAVAGQEYRVHVESAARAAHQAKVLALQGVTPELLTVLLGQELAQDYGVEPAEVTAWAHWLLAEARRLGAG